MKPMQYSMDVKLNIQVLMEKAKTTSWIMIKLVILLKDGLPNIQPDSNGFKLAVSSLNIGQE